MHQQTAFAKYLAPRHAYRNLNIHLEFMPFEIATGQSNPDFLYRWTCLDGARAYRMWGRLGTTRCDLITQPNRSIIPFEPTSLSQTRPAFSMCETQ